MSDALLNRPFVHEAAASVPRWVTPPTQADLRDPVARACPYPRSNVLPGVTRGAVIEIAKAADIGVDLAAIDVNRLLGADEVFLTNSIMAVMPVRRIEQTPVADERPGPITLQMANALRQQ
jgi:branched-subunit amino acid aminotransferase/4-amino-4-deoxychorismate lyase